MACESMACESIACVPATVMSAPRPTAPSRRGRLVPAAAALATITCGAIITVQARINGQLGRELDDGFTAASISFGSGLLILVLVLVISKRGRAGLQAVGEALVRRELPFWYVLGGCAGALIVLSQGLTASVLGVALFTIATVAGQTIIGLVLDRFGVGRNGRRALTAPRLIGALLALIAVSWAGASQLYSDIPVWMLVLPFIAGLGLGWQQAVNGHVRVVADSAITSTFISFLAGTVVLISATVIRASNIGWPGALPVEPWLYVGGVLGCIYIGVTALLVRTTGVLLLGLGLVAGQLSCSLLLDVAWPTANAPIAFSTVAGTLLALVAVLIAGIGSSGRTRPGMRGLLTRA